MIFSMNLYGSQDDVEKYPKEDIKETGLWVSHYRGVAVRPEPKRRPERPDPRLARERLVCEFAVSGGPLLSLFRAGSSSAS